MGWGADFSPKISVCSRIGDIVVLGCTASGRIPGPTSLEDQGVQQILQHWVHCVPARHGFALGGALLVAGFSDRSNSAVRRRNWGISVPDLGSDGQTGQDKSLELPEAQFRQRTCRLLTICHVGAGSERLRARLVDNRKSRSFQRLSPEFEGLEKPATSRMEGAPPDETERERQHQQHVLSAGASPPPEQRAARNPAAVRDNGYDKPAVRD